MGIILGVLGIAVTVIFGILAIPSIWPRGRAWLRREVFLKVSGLLSFNKKYVVLRRRDFTEIPLGRRYRNDNKDFNPNDVRSESDGKTRKSLKLTARINEKDGGVTDWKGCRYYEDDYLLREIWLQAWPFSYTDKNEWKIGVSISERNLPVPVPYEHRLHGEGHICFEISRHHKEGKHAVLWVFGGDPLKVPSKRISDDDWTWLRIKISEEKIEFFAQFKLIDGFGVDAEEGIKDFEPGEIWLVFWADARTDMVARFRRIKTFWEKKK